MYILCPQVVLNSTRFSLFHALDSDGRCGPVASGFLSGGIAGFISSPLARWRTIRQAGEPSSGLSARALLVASPFAGAPAWALRNAGHTACIFSFFEATRRRLEASDAMRDKPTSAVHLAASLVAASLSCILMNPLDVYCTRVFHASGGAAGAAAEAKSSIDSAGAGKGPISLRRLLRTSLRGLSANLLRTVPHTVLTFLCIDVFRRYCANLSMPPAPSAPTMLRQRLYVEASADRERAP